MYFHGEIAKIQIDEKYGLIHGSGKVVVPPKYHFIGKFSEGLAPVNIGGKWKTDYIISEFKGGEWGFINQKGKEIIPVQYRNVLDFKEGLAGIQTLSGWGYINTTGKVVINPAYTEAQDFSEGLATVLRSVKKNGYLYFYWGYIDKKHNIVIYFEYENVDNFKNGLANVKKNHKWGVIDTNGNEIIPIIYDSIFPVIIVSLKLPKHQILLLYW